jgi:hypothetical protein
VKLYPNTLNYNGHDDEVEVWDKVGEAVGNLLSLERLRISTHDRTYGDDDDDDDDDEVVPNPGWERLARILSHMR